jgi:hypothetical protein
MKKLVPLLAVVLIIGPIPVVDASTIAGTPCKKAGTTKVVSSKKHNCIQLGQKLYWDNGKIVKKTNNVLNLPATCTIAVPQWGLLPNPEGTGGSLVFSALIVNSSITNVATDVRVLLEWYDESGVSYRDTIEIPKIYPGAMPFGGIESYEINGLNNRERPDDISLKSKCSSKPINKADLIDGKFATLTGTAPIQITVDEGDGEGEYSPTYYGTSSLIVRNIFNKKFKLAYPSQLKIYGVLKDRLGNTVGGYNGQISSEGSGISTLYPGDSPRIDINLFFISPDDVSILKKFSVFEYVIIPDID